MASIQTTICRSALQDTAGLKLRAIEAARNKITKAMRNDCEVDEIAEQMRLRV